MTRVKSHPQWWDIYFGHVGWDVFFITLKFVDLINLRPKPLFKKMCIWLKLASFKIQYKDSWVA